MLLGKKPTQNAIVLWELALRGDRGLSSYRAYDNNFQVKRLAARIDDLEVKYDCVIEHRGTHPAMYYLREVPLETIAIFYKQNPALDRILGRYVSLDPTVKEETPNHPRPLITTGGLPRCRLCGSGMGNLIQKDRRWEHDESDPLAAGFCTTRVKNGK